jgi:hypothetical protein
MTPDRLDTKSESSLAARYRLEAYGPCPEGPAVWTFKEVYVGKFSPRRGWRTQGSPRFMGEAAYIKVSPPVAVRTEPHQKTSPFRAKFVGRTKLRLSRDRGADIEFNRQFQFGRSHGKPWAITSAARPKTRPWLFFVTFASFCSKPLCFLPSDVKVQSGRKSHFLTSLLPVLRDLCVLHARLPCPGETQSRASMTSSAHPKLGPGFSLLPLLPSVQKLFASFCRM